MEPTHLQLSVIELCNEDNKAFYKDLVINKFKNPYYYIEYIQYYCKFPNKLIVFLLYDHEEPIALMPIILNSIPDTDCFDSITPYGYSGPLFKESLDESYIDFFWSEIDKWYLTNNVITEFVRFNLLNNHINYPGETVKTLLNVCGAIKENFEEQWNFFDKKVRNNYRKATSFDLSFKFYKGDDLNEKIVGEFYNIYHKTMVRNNAKKSLYFSEDYFNRLILNNVRDFSIALVYFNGIAVSTELHIQCGDWIYAFLGGTDHSFFHTRPNDFLRVEVIKWAIENGRKKYVLGGGLKDYDGLYKSKKAYFPKDDDMIYYTGRKIINPVIYESLVSRKFAEHPKEIDFFPLYRYAHK